ncbi:hypothetical protein [Sphingosinicella microcystinivorans]|uniref:hypothetical protein n=1 Tax=Sphingosinicella microcystinivorans TaxID=335406 RepID=UPI0022F3BDF2|nr:hypothetical protein [Sphingosinicella microcystinivorans]WBX84579.1 hypothetical protein PE061_01215 [Sphingosinicella microcystinivorans]
MSAVPLSEIFDVEYGNKLNFNAMEADDDGVNFVSRSRMRLGVIARVKKLPSVEPYPGGLITVTFGGSYLLSTFVQPKEFYTAQNVKVLSPKGEMPFREKVYYCACIAHNRHRYSSHGREANRSLDSLLVPARSDVPSWVNSTEPEGLELSADQFVNGGLQSEAKDGEVVRLNSLFDLYNGVNPPAHYRTTEPVDDEHLPLVRPPCRHETEARRYRYSSRHPPYYRAGRADACHDPRMLRSTAKSWMCERVGKAASVLRWLAE